MNIFGLTVSYNEADRYLIPMVEQCGEIFDDHFFYDDQSTDETVDILKNFNASGEIRADGIPSFLENEGAFRGEAWQSFEHYTTPRPGDWVMVIDCDEALVTSWGADPHTIREGLEKVIFAAGNHVAVDLNIPEVFGIDVDGCPLIRTDRLWGTIHAPRLFSYRPGGHYAVGDLGVPAVPSYVMGGPWFSTDSLALLHYGYADSTDLEKKYHRYSGKLGHSNQHVESIPLQPTLERWSWPFPRQMAWKQLTSS